MKKTFSLLFVLLFLLLCLLPSAGMLLWGESESGANEILAPAPALRTGDGGVNAEVLRELSGYIGDRFRFRQEAITAWNTLCAALLRTSASPDVVLGLDGWLYFADTLPDYTGSEPMTERELWCAARTLCLCREYARSQGADFLFTIAPNKASLYPEHLPRLYRSEGESNARRLAALLEGMGVEYADLFAALGGAEEELYFAADSHWNGRGAALGADTLLAALGRESAWYTGPFAAAEHRGDLAEMLYPARMITEPDWTPERPWTFTYTRPIRAANDITIRTEKEGADGSLLMFRDSFGNNLYPYLAEEYGSALFTRQTAYDLTAIAERQADTVIVELVERNLRYLLRYDPVFPAPERALALSAEDVPLTPEAEASADGTAVTVRGALPTEAAADSPVYLLSGDALWEAVPRSEGYSAVLPAGTETGALRLIYAAADGRWLCTEPLRFPA